MSNAGRSDAIKALRYLLAEIDAGRLDAPLGVRAYLAGGLHALEAARGVYRATSRRV